MNNRKQTKRALLTSVMALALCVVMLVGTTFAWFTDTATANVNTIKAGNLNVELLDENGKSVEGQTLDFLQTDANGNVQANANILWEPGATYQLPELQIKNSGNLALKYKINVSGAKDADGDDSLDSLKLLDVLEWTYTVGTADYKLESEKSLGVGETNTLVIKAHMKESANNDYQNMAIDGIAITVYATQDTVEYDSNGNQYDKNATYLTYPAGVTTESFEQQTSVEYTNNLGNVVTGNKPAVAAYVDASGNVKYVGDIWAAIKGNASVIYCKKDATLRMRERLADTNRTPDLTNDLTIYANGANFQYGWISLNGTDLGKDHTSDGVNLVVYDARNIRIWGFAPASDSVNTITLENCTYEGGGVNQENADGIFYICTNDSVGATGIVDLTMNNCKVNGSDQGVYSNANGTITVNNCAFASCAAAMKISHKAAGTCNITVKDTTFNECGWNTDVTGKEWLKNDSSAIKCKTTGTMTLTLNNVAITSMIGSNSIVTGTSVNVNATNVTVDGTTWNN